MARRLALSALACLLLAAVAPPRPAAALSCDWWDDTCQALQQAQDRQQQVQDQLKQIQQSIVDTLTKWKQALALEKQIEAQIVKQKAAIADTKARLAATERQIRYTEADIARRQAQLQLREQLLDQRVRSMDKHGGLNYFQLVTTSTSFTQLVDRIAIMQQVVRSDQRLLDTLKQERQQVQQLKQQLDVQRAQEAALLQQQQQQEAQLEAQQQQQQATLAYLQQLQNQYYQQQQELQAEQASLTTKIAQLTQQYNEEARNAGGGSGRFGWPQRGVITQGFGCSSLPFEYYDPNCPYPHTFHTGIDIANDFGNTIQAADSGVVSYVGGLPCYGNVVVITHGNGYSTLYAHLSAFLVAQGQGVRRGQPIAQEGTTGCSTGPHLHFEIRYNGAWQNPLNYLG